MLSYTKNVGTAKISPRHYTTDFKLEETKKNVSSQQPALVKKTVKTKKDFIKMSKATYAQFLECHRAALKEIARLEQAYDELKGVITYQNKLITELKKIQIPDVSFAAVKDFQKAGQGRKPWFFPLEEIRHKN